jgi:hypothetical protein
MLVRLRAASDQRPTLASSVVATVVFGALSGYGYGPTLASSVVAWLCERDNLLVVTTLLANVGR